MNCAPRAIEHRPGVGGRCVAAPCYVAVGAHQYQTLPVERGDLGIVDVDHLERNVARLCLFGEIFSRSREAQQGEALAEEIERRAAIGEPGMRRAAARIARLEIDA